MPVLPRPMPRPLIQAKLDENQIEKAPKLEPSLLEVRHLFKTEPFMKPQRRNVVRVDSSDHDVLSQSRGPRDQRPHQLRADAPPSPRSMHMHRMFHRETVPGPRAKIAKRGEPNHGIALASYQRRIIL